MRSFQILHEYALKTLASFQELKVNQQHEPFQYTRLFNYQGYIAIRRNAALDELIYSAQVTLPEGSDQLRLYRHSASAPGAMLLPLTSSSTLDRSRYLRSQISSDYIATLDEFVYSGQVTLPEESDQLRLHCHSASAPGATLLPLTSSSTLDRSRYLRSQISSGYIAARPQRPEPHCSL